MNKIAYKTLQMYTRMADGSASIRYNLNCLIVSFLSTNIGHTEMQESLYKLMSKKPKYSEM